jgi:hypothetical protein
LVHDFHAAATRSFVFRRRRANYRRLYIHRICENFFPRRLDICSASQLAGASACRSVCRLDVDPADPDNPGERRPFDFMHRGPVGILGIYLLAPLALIGWDLYSLRRVQRATIGGLAAMTMVIAGALLLPDTAWWLAFAAWVKG